MTTIGVISPGEMGSAIGAALARGGVRAIATVAGRSERTRALAAESGLELLPDLDAVCAAADAVLSVVPPQDAEAVAASLRGRGLLWADLNATSPTAARALGCEVDGAISGPPPGAARHRATQIFLSGPRAQELARLLVFDEQAVVIVVGDEVGQASAVKMSTASVRKGRAALMAQALRTAEANGVLEYVLADLGAQAQSAGEDLAVASAKAWRFAAEMREIAATQQAAGLTPALFAALAEVWEQIAQTQAGAADPEQIPAGQPLQVTLAALRTPR